ncbi:MAG TPA: ubiquitin-like protein, partial [Myxococcota bacterium]|nr:ubiquitin-like protein [Myxococcota bacterium]
MKIYHLTLFLTLSLMSAALLAADTNKGEGFNAFVTFSRSGGRATGYAIHPDDTVAKLIIDVAKREGVKPETIRLMTGGVQLKPQNRIREYSLQSASTVQAIINPAPLTGEQLAAIKSVKNNPQDYEIIETDESQQARADEKPLQGEMKYGSIYRQRVISARETVRNYPSLQEIKEKNAGNDHKFMVEVMGITEEIVTLFDYKLPVDFFVELIHLLHDKGYPVFDSRELPQTSHLMALALSFMRGEKIDGPEIKVKLINKSTREEQIVPAWTFQNKRITNYLSYCIAFKIVQAWFYHDEFLDYQDRFFKTGRAEFIDAFNKFKKDETFGRRVAHDVMIEKFKVAHKLGGETGATIRVVGKTSHTIELT